MFHSATPSLNAVPSNRGRTTLLIASLVWLAAALSAVSPAVRAQAATVIDSGTLDRTKAAGPRWRKADFDAITSGTHTVSADWQGGADIRFALFDASTGKRFATSTDDAPRNEWVGTLDDAKQYAISVWSVSGSADVTVTLETQGSGFAITRQPADQSVTAGDEAVFSVAATGSGTLRYQWFSSAADAPDGNTATVSPPSAIAGATSARLTVDSVTSADDGNSYLVRVKDSSGSTISSDSATLTVQSGPLKVTAQPADLTVAEGDDAVFSVKASGSGTLTYRWFADGAAITGSVGARATLTLDGVARADSGTEYSVRVTDGTGARVTSDRATLTVEASQPTIDITSQPTNVTVAQGENATFAVRATGSGALGYQWYVDGSVIVGATARTYVANSVSANQDGQAYRVDVTDDNGTVVSRSATLTVDAATGPTSMASIGQGTLDSTKATAPRFVRVEFDSLGTALHTLSVSWDSDADVRFKVFKADGTALSPTVRGSNPGVWSGELVAGAEYYMSLYSADGVADYSASLEAGISLSVSRQPSDVTVTSGSNAIFSVKAAGSGSLGYQWFKNGSKIDGQTADSLTVFNTSSGDDGDRYFVRVSNGDDTVRSEIATLVVDEPVALGLYEEAADTNTWMLAGPAPTLDYQAGANTDAWGRVLLRVGNLLLVGGDFEGIKPSRGGAVTDRPFLAALDAVSGQPVSSFRVPGAVNSVVRALAYSPTGNRVYVAGDFGLLALDATNGSLDFAVDVSEGGEPGRVFDIAVTSAHVYIGGDFANVASKFRANIARLSLGGVLDNSWTPKAKSGFEAGRSAPVQAVTVSPDENTVYLGGNFGFINDTAVDRTAQNKTISMLSVDAVSGAVQPERFSPDVGKNTKAPQVHDIAVTGSYVIVAWGGPNHLTFHSLGGDRLKQYNGKGDVQSLQVVGDYVFVGHHGEFFGPIDDPIPQEAVVSVDPKELEPFKFHSFRIDDPSFQPEQAWRITGAFGIWGIAVSEDSIWLAGQVSRAGTNERGVDGLVRFSAKN